MTSRTRATKAVTKFDSGPAIATNAMSRTGRRRFRALTGTGRAHPKPASTNATAPERVDVRQRIERQPSREARRRIPETLGHPAVRDLVNGDGHQKPGNHQDQELQGPERVPQETRRSFVAPPSRPAQRERAARTGRPGTRKVPSSQRAEVDQPARGRAEGPRGIARPRDGRSHVGQRSAGRALRGRRRSRRHRSRGARGRARAAGHRARAGQPGRPHGRLCYTVRRLTAGL